MADQALWWPRGASCCEWVKINLSLSLHTCAFLYGTISKGDMHTRSTAQVTTDCSVHPHGGVDLAALTSSLLRPRPLTPARGAVPCPPGLLAPAPAALSHGCIRLLKWASVFKGPHCLYTSLTSPVPQVLLPSCSPVRGPRLPSPACPDGAQGRTQRLPAPVWPGPEAAPGHIVAPTDVLLCVPPPRRSPGPSLFLVTPRRRPLH